MNSNEGLEQLVIHFTQKIVDLELKHKEELSKLNDELLLVQAGADLRVDEVETKYQQKLVDAKRKLQENEGKIASLTQENYSLMQELSLLRAQRTQPMPSNVLNFQGINKPSENLKETVLRPPEVEETALKPPEVEETIEKEYQTNYLSNNFEAFVKVLPEKTNETIGEEFVFFNNNWGAKAKPHLNKGSANKSKILLPVKEKRKRKLYNPATSEKEFFD